MTTLQDDFHACLQHARYMSPRYIGTREQFNDAYRMAFKMDVSQMATDKELIDKLIEAAGSNKTDLGGTAFHILREVFVRTPDPQVHARIIQAGRFQANQGSTHAANFLKDIVPVYYPDRAKVPQVVKAVLGGDAPAAHPG